MLSAEDFLGVLNNYSDFAIYISLIISLIIAILGVVPSVFVTGANLIFFGPIKGFIISLIGETLGAFVTYYLYRKGFKKSFDKISDKHSLLKAISEGKGLSGGFLIFQGRLIPFIPSGFVTLAGAISEINVWVFIVATFLGKIPSILLEAFISLGVIKSGVLGIKIVLAIVGCYFIFKFIIKNIKFNKEREN